ncbi:MAG: T9SS type A sorting domain-containing protein [Candidatus Zixiibacteriota bacterium]
MSTEDGDLYFQLYNDAATKFVKNTVTTASTLDTLTFQMHHNDGSSAYGGISITEICFTLEYASAYFELVGCEVVEDNWYCGATPGTVADIDSTYNGSDIRVRIRLAGGCINPSTTATAYAMVFMRPICGVSEYSDIAVDYYYDDNAYSYIELGAPSYAQYNPGTHTGTNVHIADYMATFDIDDDVLAYLGGTVSAAVKASTNFRLYGWKHVIQYVNTELQFDSVTIGQDILPGGCFEFYSTSHCPDDASAASGEITVEIWNDYAGTYPAWSFPYYTPELSEQDLYYIWFTVISSSDDITSNLTFDYADCFVRVYNSAPACQSLNGILGESDYVGGSVDVPYYEAGILLDYTGINGDEVTYDVLMNNNFPAGKTNGSSGLRFNFNLSDYFDGFHTLLSSSFHDDLKFSYCYSSGLVSIYQIDGSGEGKPNYAPVTDIEYDNLTYEKLFTMTVDLDEEAVDCAYDDRFLAPAFTGYACSSPGYIYDTTTHVLMFEPGVSGVNRFFDDSTNGYEFEMAEFFNTAASTSNPYVQSDIYIRNNFDAGEFTVTIDVGGSGWCIDCIYNVHDSCTATKIDDDTYEIEWTATEPLDANGNDSTFLGRVVFGVPEPCTGYNSYNVTPSISGTAENTSSTSMWVAAREYQVTGGCYNGHGCDAAVVQSPCPGGGGGSKSVNEPINSLIPMEFALHPNRPNPFNPQTIISYDVPVATHVSIEIFNILGQKIVTLVDEEKVPGSYEVIWNGNDYAGQRVASGIYLYNMRAGDFVDSKKMMLMK